MKLVKQPFSDDEVLSFKEHDELGREPFGQALFNVITRTDDSLVIALDASWGEGKTTFVKMWQTFLKEKGVKTIYFDAFANDYLDEPFIALASEITEFFSREISPKNNTLAEFKKNAAILFSWGTKLALKAAIARVIKGMDLDEELSEIKKELIQDSANVLSNPIDKKLNIHQQKKETIQSFKKNLQKLIVKIKETPESKGPLVIIIDELDRCKPVYALELIENIKHIFSVENIVFLLVMHKQQLEEVVRHVYGQNIDATTYLQKFINIECRLPKNTEALSSGDYETYCRSLTQQHDLNDWQAKDNFEKVISQLGRRFNLSLRDLERCYTNLTVFYATVQNKKWGELKIICLLAVLKVRFPELYLAMKEKRNTSDKLYQELNSKSNEDEKWGRISRKLKTELQSFLLSPEQYNALDENDEIKWIAKNLGMVEDGIDDRNTFIPRCCEYMDMFRFPED